jgi:uncharacterized protein (TIGR03067 family)
MRNEGITDRPVPPWETAAMTPLLLTLAGMLPGADGPGNDAGKADRQRLQGAWVAVTEHPGGMKQTTVLDFKGDRLTLTVVSHDKDHAIGNKFQMTYTLDPGRTPKRIKLRADDELLKDVPLEGIYAFEGDTLLLAFIKPGKGPPKDFKGKPGPDGPFTFKRHKPTPKP